ncbi:PREDICTED: uncharacterized protein LOC104806059 isoform X1 [Tarenaya hassleriana]|uniref:uncharacterized protein LOC104806059 isoform X1 n=1 Tax=Tarenaya hassleriana TaxID=28532 RepID=UPI00053C9F30|nr:PREDICTED: uncharacterized protein LOC104806059 isoform X1 [Tarenaya hassleriana]
MWNSWDVNYGPLEDEEGNHCTYCVDEHGNVEEYWSSKQSIEAWHKLSIEEIAATCVDEDPFFEQEDEKECVVDDNVFDHLPSDIKEALISTIKHCNIRLTPSLLESLCNSNEFVQMMEKRQEESTIELIVKEKTTENKVERGHKQETSLASHKEDTTSQKLQPYEETLPSPIHDNQIRSISTSSSLSFRSHDVLFAREDTNQISVALEADDTKEGNKENTDLVELEDLNEKAKTLDEAPKTSEMQLFLSPQRNPSTTIIWLITRVCDLFSCPMKLDTFFQDNICGSLSITQQSLNEELFKLFKHTSEGKHDGTLICFLSKRNARNGETSKEETKNRNLKFKWSMNCL